MHTHVYLRALCCMRACAVFLSSGSDILILFTPFTRFTDKPEQKESNLLGKQDSHSENGHTCVANIPVGFSLITWLPEFLEACLLFLISFCLWQDLSINDFFLFINASCKLPGAGITFGRVSVKKKKKNSPHWTSQTSKIGAENLSRGFPLALGC